MKTKIIILVIIGLLIIGTIGMIWGAQIAEAASGFWNSCPRGETNCNYPGKCRLYIDTNGDKICDRSQSSPGTITTTPTVKGTTSAIGTYSPGPSIPATLSATPNSSEKTVLAAVLPDNSSNTSFTSDQNTLDPNPEVLEPKQSYYFVPILLIIIILYTFTWMLSAKKLIRNLLHRRIWNLVLLVSMLVSALLGIFLILVADFNIGIALPFNILFWHVEAGIALGIVGILHIIWHWRYFAKMIKSNAKIDPEII
jgi:hypothetical protein